MAGRPGADNRRVNGGSIGGSMSAFLDFLRARRNTALLLIALAGGEATRSQVEGPIEETTVVVRL